MIDNLLVNVKNISIIIFHVPFNVKLETCYSYSEMNNDDEDFLSKRT